MLRTILVTLACIAMFGCADTAPGVPAEHAASARADSFARQRADGRETSTHGADTDAAPERVAGTGARTEVASAIEVVDDAGRTVRLDAPARRILSLIPARTDLLLAIGAADRLIARTRYDDDPRLAHLPSLGDALTPSVEWIAAEQPDLVIAWPDTRSRDVVHRLIELGIPVYGSRVESLDDVNRAIGHVGQLLGLEARADSIAHAIRATHDRVRAAVARRDRPGVLYLIGLDPVMAAGPGTFIDELIGIAGGRNIFADAGALWPQISLEEIVRRDPALIVMASDDVAAGDLAERLAARAGWRDIAAVRTGRVYRVDPATFNRPGPSVGPAAAALARLLHPGALPEGPP